ncbi:MGDG synthase family glycosyltransferase [Aneurinibacillus aneurinilyticus]|jgi:processive 1,2-diacylglycerol beta-glucosyltransferase|uniref:Glycosyltransferase n=1 Tax=Aneurinibacillus aneurinilyticus TaxID=1391 RepID=A0A848CRA4_ANEAE|nr:glycosyltransferase [Aneurinibacillus aneurinilyticus]MCI1694076.1 glycosyltransferase [Aneurinibacillus aneurinilyticus]MED0671245.1 glycosyltransferase [Aneurinibacillus aneurinilyticus]NME98205.1 glycosyltransferase [Aneurinibacillus aneurinilyticus]
MVNTKTVSTEKILILSGNYGDGHQQVAHAIQESVRLRLPEAETLIVDFMEYIHPYFHSIGRNIFIGGVKNFPSVYGYIYRKTRVTNPFSIFIKSFNHSGIRRMMRLLQEFQPSIVISTFPLAAGMISKIKELGLTNVAAVTVITDHTDHSYWLHPFTDQYIVGSEFVRKSLHQLEVNDDQITVTGIPVRPEFCRAYNRDILREKFNFDPDLPTILIMGGGYGIMGEGMSELLSSQIFSQPVQLIVVCGHNEKLRREMENHLNFSQQRVLVTGYVNYIHELMAISDFMITKPGGVTTAEAIALELPMLLYKPLPGQEQDNTQFLLNSRVALYAEDEAELQFYIAQVLKNPKLLIQMKESARRMHSKWTASKVVDVISSVNFEWQEIYV